MDSLGSHIRICPPVVTVLFMQRMGPPGKHAPPAGLVILTTVARFARPRLLKTINGLLVAITTLRVPSLPSRDWMVRGQSPTPSTGSKSSSIPSPSVSQLTHPKVQDVSNPVKENCTLALRLMASARASCKPDEIESAAVRI